MFDSAKFDAMYAALLDFLDGREVTIDGMRGRIRVTRGTVGYPYPRKVETIHHEPYVAVRRPGLACITDLGSPDAWGLLMAVAKRQGFKFADHGYDW